MKTMSFQPQYFIWTNTETKDFYLWKNVIGKRGVQFITTLHYEKGIATLTSTDLDEHAFCTQKEMYERYERLSREKRSAGWVLSPISYEEYLAYLL